MIELNLHNNGPDIDADIEDDDSVETNLGTTALAKTFHVENESEAKTANANNHRR